jgi:toxin ParE1/3/4
VNRNIHEEAQVEFLAALDHYASVSADLGERFYAEIERLMEAVCAAPKRFRKYDPPARRHLARDFPYALVYIENEDHVSIIAVMPLRREPGYWKHRLV